MYYDKHVCKDERALSARGNSCGGGIEHGRRIEVIEESRLDPRQIGRRGVKTGESVCGEGALNTVYRSRSLINLSNKLGPHYKPIWIALSCKLSYVLGIVSIALTVSGALCSRISVIQAWASSS